jgi:hypothetical protein
MKNHEKEKQTEIKVTSALRHPHSCGLALTPNNQDLIKQKAKSNKAPHIACK